MFAYILHAPNTPPSEQTDEFFRRFCETPGLVHAYDLTPADGSGDAAMVAIWQDRESAERYLREAALRREVDEAIPEVRRIMYDVHAHK
jgi:hypothetical protein